MYGWINGVDYSVARGSLFLIVLEYMPHSFNSGCARSSFGGGCLLEEGFYLRAQCKAIFFLITKEYVKL